MSEAYDNGAAEAASDDNLDVLTTVEDAEEQNQSGDDAAAETDDGEEGEEQQPEARERRRSAQERIDELTRDRHAERRRAEAAEQRAAELEARYGRQQERPQAQQQASGDDEPNPDDYPYGEADVGYMKAAARFEARQEFRELAAAERQQRESASVMQSFNDRAAKFVEAKPDFHDVISRAEELPDAAKYAIFTSEAGPAVAYHLASNPAEARRFAALDPLAQAREIGRLEARLATPAATQTPTKTVSDAPAPAPQNRGNGGRFSVAPDTDDFAAFLKAYGERS